MKVLVTVQHPAHVHFFRNAIDELRRTGHDVHVCARAKDVTVELLELFGLPHEVLVNESSSPSSLAATQALYESRLLRRARRFDPDVVTAIGGLAASHVAALTDAWSVVFTDTETKANRLMSPFADLVCTPAKFEQSFGKKQLRYDGFHELAYLHPNHFEPRTDLLREAGVDPDEPYYVLRFSDMRAHHDVGQSGLSGEAKRRIATSLAERGPVYVSMEGSQNPPVGEPIPTASHYVHHLLAGADLFVTDSTTMAVEAGLLGTPSIRSNSFAGEDDLSNLLELADYGLVYSTPAEAAAEEKVTELAGTPGVKQEWMDRRRTLLENKIDVTAFVVRVLLGLGKLGVPPRELARRGVALPDSV